MEDNKALFDYWHDRVVFKNKTLIGSPTHVMTQQLRHECTNYDELRLSDPVRTLTEPERSRVIAIIKYECTARVLQYRSGLLRDRATELETVFREIKQERSKLLGLIKALQQKLFGKDQELARLEARIAVLDVENEALRADAENNKAYVELLADFEQLQKRFEQLEQRKKELAKTNQSLGGRVAHTQRFRRERDQARVLVEQQQQQIATLTATNCHLAEENATLRSALENLQQPKNMKVNQS